MFNQQRKQSRPLVHNEFSSPLCTWFLSTHRNSFGHWCIQIQLRYVNVNSPPGPPKVHGLTEHTFLNSFWGEETLYNTASLFPESAWFKYEGSSGYQDSLWILLLHLCLRVTVEGNTNSFVWVHRQVTGCKHSLSKAFGESLVQTTSIGSSLFGWEQKPLLTPISLPKAGDSSGNPKKMGGGAGGGRSRGDRRHTEWPSPIPMQSAPSSGAGPSCISVGADLLPDQI